MTASTTYHLLLERVLTTRKSNCDNVELPSYVKPTPISKPVALLRTKVRISSTSFILNNLWNRDGLSVRYTSVFPPIVYNGWLVYFYETDYTEHSTFVRLSILGYQVLLEHSNLRYHLV